MTIRHEGAGMDREEGMAAGMGKAAHLNLEQKPIDLVEATHLNLRQRP